MATTVTLQTVEDDKYCSRMVNVTKLALNHVLRDFNPALTEGNPVGQHADTTKVLCAAVIQQMIDLRDDRNAAPYTKRAAAIAITQLELACMCAVKANFSLA